MSESMKNISKLTRWSRKVNNKTYDRGYLYFPTQVIKDEKFPFKYGEKIAITIENGRVILDTVKGLEAIPPAAPAPVEQVKPELKPVAEPNPDSKSAPAEQVKPLEAAEPKFKAAKPKKEHQPLIIICPKCGFKNNLYNRTAPDHTCSGCGFKIKRENYVFDKPKTNAQEQSATGGGRDGS